MIEQLETRTLLAGDSGLDTSFGAAGFAPVAARTFLSVLPDGKILTADAPASDSTKLSLTLLNSNGTVDTHFKENAAPKDVLVNGAVTVSGDRVYIGGISGPAGGPLSDRRVFVRAIHLSDGSADTSFGSGGIVKFVPRKFTTVDTSAYSFQFDSMIVTETGGVIFGLEEFASPSNVKAVMCKVTPAGQLDATFGTSGTLVMSDAADFTTRGPGDTILRLTTNNLIQGVRRYRDNGTLDTFFGQNGVAQVDGDRVQLEPDGKILVMGVDSQDQFQDAILSQLNVNGSADRSFGDNGSIRFHAKLQQFLTVTATTDAENQIIGYISGSAQLFRLTPEGQFDPTFGGGDGTVKLGGALSGALATDEAGRILVGQTDDKGVSRILPQSSPAALLPGGVLSVMGTDNSDSIQITRDRGTLRVSLNDRSFEFNVVDVDRVVVRGLSGDDSIANRTSRASDISGDAGDDRIIGGNGDDTIGGGAGDDRIDGGAGNDTIAGNGGNDRLTGGDGSDLMHGNAGEDYFDAFDHQPDTILGDGGADLATADNRDVLTSIVSPE